MKILFTASECVPFVKTGGLADVVGALAPVLAKQGHDVRVILPLYAAIAEKWTKKMTHVVDFEVQLGWRRQYCGIEMLEQDGVKWYFMDNKYYFGRPYIYGLGGDEYERYGFFCRAALNALPLLNFQPDVIHAHDWQSGMVPALLKIQYAHLPFYANIKTMFTIHNLQYQGVFGIREVQDILGLGDSLWTNDKLECYGCANFMKAALVYADLITTVSPSYSEEIQTAYYGERLDGLLRARKAEVFGVLNGIDMVDYDPAVDQRIPAVYSLDHMEGKVECKRALQEKLGLEVDPSIPVIGMVGRLSNQKGLDLVDCIIGDLMQDKVQLVVLGQGESRYVNLFSWAEGEYKGKVAARFAMDHALAHQIYAGCDMFLMPSQFEPCGLSQMIALRYGTVPIVRETGGLRDTVLSYNEYTGAGNGFTFFNYNAHDMLHTIRRALHYYNNDKDVWNLLRQRGMSGDYSWTNSAGKYLELYTSMMPKVVVEEKSEKTAESVTKPVKKDTPIAAKIADEVVSAPVEKPKRTRKKKEEAPADETAAPAKPKRACRKKSETISDVDEARMIATALVEAMDMPEPVPSESEKPKRACKKKAAAPVAEEQVVEKSACEVKPKRCCKKKEAAPEVVPEAVAEEAVAAETPAPTKKTRCTRKKAETPAVVSAEEGPAEKPKKPRAPRKKKTDEGNA